MESKDYQGLPQMIQADRLVREGEALARVDIYRGMVFAGANLTRVAREMGQYTGEFGISEEDKLRIVGEADELLDKGVARVRFLTMGNSYEQMESAGRALRELAEYLGGVEEEESYGSVLLNFPYVGQEYGMLIQPTSDYIADGFEDDERPPRLDRVGRDPLEQEVVPLEPRLFKSEIMFRIISGEESGMRGGEVLED